MYKDCGTLVVVQQETRNHSQEEKLQTFMKRGLMKIDEQNYELWKIFKVWKQLVLPRFVPFYLSRFKAFKERRC